MLKYLNYMMPLNYQATDLKQVNENNKCKSDNYALGFSSNQNGIRHDERSNKRTSIKS